MLNCFGKHMQVKGVMVKQVLAKLDENYTPVEVVESMADASAKTGISHQTSSDGMDMSGNKNC